MSYRFLCFSETNKSESDVIPERTESPSAVKEEPHVTASSNPTRNAAEGEEADVKPEIKIELTKDLKTEEISEVNLTIGF